MAKFYQISLEQSENQKWEKVKKKKNYKSLKEFFIKQLDREFLDLI